MSKQHGYFKTLWADAFGTTWAEFGDHFGKPWLVVYYTVVSLPVYVWLGVVKDVSAEITAWMQGLIAIGGATVLLIAGRLITAPYRIWKRDQETLGRASDELLALKSPKIEVFAVIADDSVYKYTNIANPTKLAAKYIKVGVRAVSQNARDCRPFIVKMSEILKDGSIDAPLFDPIELKWSTIAVHTTDLVKGLPKYFDVLWSMEPDNHLDMPDGVARPIKVNDFFRKNPALFRVDVVVTCADGTAVEQAVYVQWNGEMKSIVVSAKQPRSLADGKDGMAYSSRGNQT